MKKIFFCFLLATSLLHAQTLVEWDAPSKPSPNLHEAQFRMWLPEGVKTIRGVLVISPGRNGDGRNAIVKGEWQRFATEHHFALMGCRLFEPKGAYQLDPDGKTTATIEKALTELAVLAEKPEIKTAPLAFWGHSAGANLSQYFAGKNPKRTIAVVLVKPTSGPGDCNPQKANVPILILLGKKDRADWVNYGLARYADGVKAKAIWTMALHDTEGHSLGATQPFALTFLNEVITKRLGDLNSPTSTPGLKAIPYSDGWLGNPLTHEIFRYADYKGVRRDAAWLPGPQSAEAWKIYLDTPAEDKTAMPADE